jgi:hypothetical protein
LGQDENAAQIGIDAIGKGDVDDAIEPAERHRGLGAIAGQGPQPLALSSGKQYSDGIPHLGHGSPRYARRQRGTF